MSPHIPVLLKEVLAMLSPEDGGVYFDGTFGGGGYTRAILEAANCRVIASDRDSFVEKFADEVKSLYPSRFDFFHEKFGNIKSICGSEQKLDGVILDLGVSTFQLTDPERGFSFNLSGPVDMGMGLCDQTAMDVIRKYKKQDLANIIYEFGEEHFSRRIAENIKKNIGKIHTTEDLARVIRSCVKKTGKTDPATKTFQSLRIFVNKELDELKKVLRDSVDLLNPGGKIIAVSFHSLEDRIVKLFFRELIKTRPEFREKSFTLLTKKPIIPSAEEIAVNPKSRSAKLRGISVVC
ncbi:MAG: 16S rRNA (cytosine(1402)-N(4))-methyltransferase RsmH [Holosporaceae bacterium]|jgi:16S rRNA (cytosine1402-N4)-methyltransferase|nr:16S rRNA (cytosine(1402)-N(4))-methyltransferase RsmH [Holosporaceae bacterium]